MKAAVFDAYGTLFDVTGAARLAAAEDRGEALRDSWPEVAALWRDKQLQYTWLRAVADAHADFAQVTGDALDYTLEALGIADGDLRGRLMRLYETLPAYPEAEGALAALRERGLKTAILSNGTPAMLDAALGASGLHGFDAVISAEEAGVYKPHADLYALAEAHLGVPPGDTLFVSSNGWDAAGAAGFGFRTAWVNRRGEPVDRVLGTPDHVVSDLSALAGLL